MAVAVAYDDTPEGRAALRHATGEAVLRGTSLAVLRVLDRRDTDVAPLRAAVARALADDGHADLGWSLHTAYASSGRSRALLALTQAAGADLLVLGARGRTPIGKFLLGSTVQRVVLDVPTPVFVVKAPAGGRPPPRPRLSGRR